MKTPLNFHRGRVVALFSILAGLGFSSTGSAASEETGCGGCCSATVAAAATTSDEYPLTTCVVSGETLGEMGKPVDYIHKEEGKPDRLVRFCCKSCIKDFKKDPAKYLKKIDDAAAEKAKGEHAAHTM